MEPYLAEAHETLAIAMNRMEQHLAAEKEAKIQKDLLKRENGDSANSKVKQIASARFGVTIEYLNNCKEIEIKISQGAKPGEGGQLPGFKVSKEIAKLRHSTPGVTLYLHHLIMIFILLKIWLNLFMILNNLTLKQELV